MFFKGKRRKKSKSLSKHESLNYISLANLAFRMMAAQEYRGFQKLITFMLLFNLWHYQCHFLDKKMEIQRVRSVGGKAEI